MSQIQILTMTNVVPRLRHKEHKNTPFIQGLFLHNKTSQSGQQKRGVLLSESVSGDDNGDDGDELTTLRSTVSLQAALKDRSLHLLEFYICCLLIF